MSNEGEYKTLDELRVTELKAELDKRGLDKNGIKIILADRLKKALKVEGHDPDVFKFCVNESVNTPLTSPSKENTSINTSPAKPNDEQSSQVQENGTVSEVSENERKDVEMKDDVFPNNELEMAIEDSEGEKTAEDLKVNGEDEQLEDPLNEPVSQPTLTVTKPADSNQLSDPDRMFWVRGLNPTTKAADLRELFSQYGKVVRAKIFTSKKSPGKTFGLLTVGDPEIVDKCFTGQHNKQWNGTTITIEKGNVSNMGSKTTAAAGATVAKKDVPRASIKEENKTEDANKDKSNKDEAKTGEKKNGEKDREREKRDADRSKPRRESIREPPRRDGRKAITAARRPVASSGRSGYRSPPPISSRLSRPISHRSPPRRVESYSSRSTLDRDRQRAREDELRRRAAEMELERERERLRAEREKIEREKLELQLLQQKAQLAAYKASHGSSRSHHDTSHRVSSSANSRRDDRYASSRGGDRTNPVRDRDRPSRADERRQPGNNGDRSRSRHDSHQDNHRDNRYQDSRRDGRHEQVAARTTSGTYTSARAYAGRDAGASTAGGQGGYYGSRESYTAGIAPREYSGGSRVAPTATTWGDSTGTWTGVQDSNWSVKPSGGEYSGAGTWAPYTGAASGSSVRIDYDKYHRQRQF